MGFISYSKEAPNLRDIANLARILFKNPDGGSTHQVEPYLVVVNMGGVGVLGEHGILSVHLCGFLEGRLQGGRLYHSFFNRNIGFLQLCSSDKVCV